jgi:serine protease Do
MNKKEQNLIRMLALYINSKTKLKLNDIARLSGIAHQTTIILSSRTGFQQEEPKMKWKILGISILMTVLLTAVNGCVYFKLDSTPTPVPTTAPSPINAEWIPPVAAGGTDAAIYPDFIPLIEKVRPSVVAIDITVSSFDVLGGTIPQKGAGSGWVIDDSGLIVTNNHIVEGADSIIITLEDGRSFQAATVRADPVADIAVVKISASGLKAVQIGDSDKLKAGQWVLALGNSLGQGISATKGIVSNLGVTIQISASEALYNLIQTDAAINPGNSGGPLFNLAGEVVGITSVKVSEVGVEGTGYAISMDEALPIITDLVKMGYYSRPWIGVSLYNVDQIVKLRYKLAVDSGALVTRVAAGSPAEKIGIVAGDVITAINGKTVADVNELNQELHKNQIGQSVTLTYYHGIAPNTVTITLAPSPPV